MKQFRVALIDDEHKDHEAIGQRLAERSDIVLLHATTTQEAKELVEKEFLHLAIVDLSLTPGNHEGTEVLNDLRRLRPACERVLYTRSDREDRAEAFEALNAVHPLVTGFVDKLSFNTDAFQLVVARADRWLKNIVDVAGTTRVHAELQKRRASRNELGGGLMPTTVDEVDYVLSSLFGQRDVELDTSTAVTRVDSVELEPINSGWSRSVVLTATPRAKDLMQDGVSCVVKIGPIEDARQELQRYRALVRYGLKVSERVELLGHALGDTIGAVCYAHEVSSADTPDLESVFAEQRDGTMYIRRLFSTGWGGVGTAPNMRVYFNDNYGIKVDAIRLSVRSFLENNGAEVKGYLRGDQFDYEAGSVLVPKADLLSSAEIRGLYNASLVHGDLHGGNVLLTADSTPKLIDYRNLSIGPRFLDHASVEIGIRLPSGDANATFSQLVAGERELWSDAFESGKPPAGAPPYWARMALVVRQAAREEYVDDFDAQEYARTLLLMALRVFNSRTLSSTQRFQLVAVIGVMAEALENKEEGGA